jgi:hypothetical protein
VPASHFGVVPTWEDFDPMVQRLRSANVPQDAVEIVLPQEDLPATDDLRMSSHYLRAALRRLSGDDRSLQTCRDVVEISQRIDSSGRHPRILGCRTAAAARVSPFARQFAAGR